MPAYSQFQKKTIEAKTKYSLRPCCASQRDAHENGEIHAQTLATPSLFVSQRQDDPRTERN